jgi:hypothetical protein
MSFTYLCDNLSIFSDIWVLLIEALWCKQLYCIFDVKPAQFCWILLQQKQERGTEKETTKLYQNDAQVHVKPEFCYWIAIIVIINYPEMASNASDMGSWSLSLPSSGWQFFFPLCNGEGHKHIGSFCTWVVLPAVVDNFSFSLSRTRGPKKVGLHTDGVHILCWVDMSLFWATVFWVCYLQTVGVRVCFHWVAVTTTSFFKKGFCGWESHMKAPQKPLFSLGTRVERPSPL